MKNGAGLARYHAGRGDLGKAFDTMVGADSVAHVDRFGRRAVCIPCRDCDGGAWFARDADGRWGLVSDDCTCQA